MSTQHNEIYIRAGADHVWKAMTTGSYTQQYFFGSFVKSAFTPGAALHYTAGDSGPMMVDGKVLEVDAGKRLVSTWHICYDPTLAGETSKVTWLLEPRGENVKLTLTHDFTNAPLTAKQLATDGWSIVLSSLKSLVETGTALTIPMGGN